MEALQKMLTDAAVKILKPLVRVLLRNGFSHSDFSEIARRVFVEVGFNELEVGTRRQTVSRVAVLTGLSRKEVVRLRELSDSETSVAPLNRAGKVIGGWVSDPEFTTATGEAKSLPLYGDTASFAALIKRYSGDITAGAILDELLRVGAVEMQGDAVKPTNKGYVPSYGQEEKVRLMGVCATDLLNTMEHNLTHEGDDARFQRAVMYHSLPEETVREFKAISGEKASQLLMELNQWLVEKKRLAEANPTNKNNQRVGLGVYFFEETLKPTGDV